METKKNTSVVNDTTTENDYIKVMGMLFTKESVDKMNSANKAELKPSEESDVLLKSFNKLRESCSDYKLKIKKA